MAKVVAGLMLLIGSACTCVVASVHLASGGMVALGEHLTGLHAASLAGDQLTGWAVIVFATALLQLVAALFLLRAKASGFVAAAAVLAFGVCLYDLQAARFHFIGAFDATSIVGSFFALPAALAKRRKVERHVGARPAVP